MELILLALATWRITSLLKDEEGPFDIFVKLRKYFGVIDTDEVVFDEYGNTTIEPLRIIDDTFIAKLFECHWCLSVWAAFGISVLAVLFSVIDSNYFLFYWLAISAGSIIIDERINE